MNKKMSKRMFGLGIVFAGVVLAIGLTGGAPDPVLQVTGLDEAVQECRADDGWDCKSIANGCTECVHECWGGCPNCGMCQCRARQTCCPDGEGGENCATFCEYPL